MIILHDPVCADYETPGHPESPARTKKTAEYLSKNHSEWSFQKPKAASLEDTLLAHSQEYLERLTQAEDFDGDTAYHDGIRDHALRATGAALECVQLALQGKRAFSLMRPPGHHACRSRAMGFCYLNHIAIAALHAHHHSNVERIAVWDFDAHHGNGTEAILHGVEDTLFCSVHQHPCYPGTGLRNRDNCLNWQARPYAPRQEHMGLLQESFDQVLKFKPDLILVSAGFDAYAGDPITQLSLEAEDFAACGQWLAKCEIPFASILEGGYSHELPRLIEAYLLASNGS